MDKGRLMGERNQYTEWKLYSEKPESASEGKVENNTEHELVVIRWLCAWDLYHGDIVDSGLKELNGQLDRPVAVAVQDSGVFRRCGHGVVGLVVAPEVLDEIERSWPGDASTRLSKNNRLWSYCGRPYRSLETAYRKAVRNGFGYAEAELLHPSYMAIVIDDSVSPYDDPGRFWQDAQRLSEKTGLPLVPWTQLRGNLDLLSYINSNHIEPKDKYND